MKKHILLFLTFLCLCLLTACGGEKRVFGEVVAYDIAPDGALTSFVVQTDAGKRVGVLMGPDSWVVAWPDGVSEEDFTSGALDGVMVTVDYTGKAQTLTLAEGENFRAWAAETVFIDQVLAKNARTLSDGTPVYEWVGSSSVSYRLADRTELLWESGSYGPENVYVGGSEGYDGLSEPAKAAVSAFYEEQGLLYSVEEELENAYAAYLSCEDKAEFTGYHVGQEISPISSNRRLMSFLTTVTLPVEAQVCTQRQLCAIFDRTTGERLDVRDLFTCDEETVLQTILDIAGITDSALRGEMEAAFDPEYLIFFPENLDLTFPAGTLPSQEHSFGLGLEYGEDLRAILHDWAVPENPDGAG